jgi:hypothetical protein
LYVLKQDSPAVNDADKIWDYFTKLPLLLDQYGRYSYPLLGVLLVGGLLILGIQFYRKRSGGEGLAGTLVGFGVALCFLSLSGFFLKWVGAVQERRQRQAFIDEHRVPAGEQRLLVFDFRVPGALSETARAQYETRMQLLVDSMDEIFSEDLPQEFRRPRVQRVPTAKSPWREVNSDNYDHVIQELKAFEILWGNVYGDQAKTFLGISDRLAGKDLETFVTLRDFDFNEDPRRDHRFGDGYYRVLGLAMLGMALDTYRKAEQAAGDERKGLFIQAVQQFNKAREAVNNRREDKSLEKTVYSGKVDALIQTALKESGVAP